MPERNTDLVNPQEIIRVDGSNATATFFVVRGPIIFMAESGGHTTVDEARQIANMLDSSLRRALGWRDRLPERIFGPVSSEAAPPGIRFDKVGIWVETSGEQIERQGYDVRALLEQVRLKGGSNV